MKSLVLSILILFTITAQASWQELHQLFDSEGLKIVEDSSNRRVKSLLLFLQDRKGLKMKSSLINQLGPGVIYYIVKSPNIPATELTHLIKPGLKAQITLNFVDYDRCFTPWVQDFFFRMTDRRNNPVVLPTFSKNLMLNDCKPFEIGIIDELEANFGEFRSLLPTDYSSFEQKNKLFNLHRVAKNTGEIYANSSTYRNMFPIRFFRYFYGEGGTRLATKEYLFIERTELSQITSFLKREFPAMSDTEIQQNLEMLFNKQIIPIGSSLPANKFYVYHIDFFLNPVYKNNRLTLFLGHPSKTEEILGDAIKLMPGYSETLHRQKAAYADSILNELRTQGFKVELVPLYFIQTPATARMITFNNVLQSLNSYGKPAVFISNYDFGPEAKDPLEKLKSYMVRTYNKYGITAHFIDGGEKFVDANGQLRCSAGVLNYHQ